VKSLEESVQIMAQAQLNRDLSPEKIVDIVAFLESLTGEFPTQTMPRLPPTPGDLLD
jgi:cytochrome c peroxidase